MRHGPDEQIERAAFQKCKTALDYRQFEEDPYGDEMRSILADIVAQFSQDCQQQGLHLMSTANWSELPNDVLGYLIGFLALPDYYRFGAVCRNWSTVAREKHHRPAQQLPWLVLGEDIATKKRIFFNISDNKHYYIDIPELHGQFVCGSSFGWLFTVDNALNIRMLNPLTRKSYNLPPLDFGHEDLSNECDKKLLVHNVIVDHDPNERSKFTVMIICGNNYNRVAFWRRGDPTWKSAILPYGIVYNIIYFNGQFYAVGRHQHEIFIVTVGPDSKLIPLQHNVPMIQNTYLSLVDLHEELLLIQWDRLKMGKIYSRNVAVPTVSTEYGVWKLDFEKGIYSQCEHINNHALFIGHNSPVVIDPSQFAGLTQNSIYFTLHLSVSSRDWARRNCIEICNLATKNLTTYYSFKNSSSEYVTPIWLAPNP